MQIRQKADGWPGTGQEETSEVAPGVCLDFRGCMSDVPCRPVQLVFFSTPLKHMTFPESTKQGLLTLGDTVML